MPNVPLHRCYVIPPPMLWRIAEQTSDDASRDARATLEQMRELAAGDDAIVESSTAVADGAAPPRRRRHIYDAQQQLRLSGRLVMSDHKARSADTAANEFYDGSGATYDFFEQVFRRASLDAQGMRLDATVHYGAQFRNAFWSGRQMVYGDGDGCIFRGFTSPIEMTAHGLTHAVTQSAVGLTGAGQTAALHEHLCDAFGMMVKQYTLGQSAQDSDWLIGGGIFGDAVNAIAVRSMAAPGTAYDDPLLGRDPQPWHMSRYVRTRADNGGASINSGILNHAFYLAAMALGGKTWEVLGRVWYIALTERLKPDAVFADFARATVDIAGELFGNGGHVQRTLADAWFTVGLTIPIFNCATPHVHQRRQHPRPHLGRRAKWSLERRTP